MKKTSTKKIIFCSLVFFILSETISAQLKLPAIEGPYKPTWESLEQYSCPEWFRDAKFGIWAHWGPQSVPELTDWYARFMYSPQTGTLPGGTFDTWQTGWKIKAYLYHCEHYGHPSVFGYKDLIPLFKAEKWDPEALMKLYYKAGARYFMSMGQHHDNFDMWNSKYQPWNSVNMGPKKDIVKGWQQAAKNNNMKFGVSFHGAPSWNWFEPSRGADLDGPRKGVPYDGNLTKEDGNGKWWEGYDPQDLYCRPHTAGDPPDEAYKQKFYNRINDMVENYRPDMIYFDGGLPFGGLDIAAYYYNQSQQWNNSKNQAVITIKGVRDENRQKAIVLDIENGQSDKMKKNPWQTDTSLDGWFLYKGAKPASTKDIVLQLVDIVSKNGNLMLNITQHADGTIQDYAYKFLEEMGQWMDINSEAIHETRPWEIFGEGPTNVVNGEQNKSQRLNYTSEDIRFTTRGNSLYAILLGWPGKEVTIKSLPKGKVLWFGKIKKIQMLGTQASLKWVQNEKGITVQLPATPPCQYAYTLKISGK